MLPLQIGHTKGYEMSAADLSDKRDNNGKDPVFRDPPHGGSLSPAVFSEWR